MAFKRNIDVKTRKKGFLYLNGKLFRSVFEASTRCQSNNISGDDLFLLVIGPTRCRNIERRFMVIKLANLAVICLRCMEKTFAEMPISQNWQKYFFPRSVLLSLTVRPLIMAKHLVANKWVQTILSSGGKWRRAANNLLTHGKAASAAACRCARRSVGGNQRVFLSLQLITSLQKKGEKSSRC